MAEKRVQRRLAAIAIADVVGYSRMMGIDEAGTLAAVTARRKQIIEPVVAANDGRIVKLMGDGFFIEFASAVNAVEAALELQAKMTEANAGLSPDRRIVLRIGINLGEVIVEGDDLFGDGVNVAARLESIASEGGIAISGSAYEQVKSRVSAAMEDIGAQTFKNIAEPVRVYRVTAAPNGSAAGSLLPEATRGNASENPSVAGLPRKSGGKRVLAIAAVLALLALGWFFRAQWLPTTQALPQAAAPGETAVQPKADVRAIAVLPLVNASNDPEQQFFSDGLSENLITSLARFDGLRVIGRISAFQFRDSKDDSATIGRKLGVDYLLNGSVQHAGDLVRINASLTNAADGSTLWAEHYDRPYKDLFALQDEIAQAVAGALHARLLSTNAAARHDDRPPSGSIDAYNAYLQGLKYWHDEEFGKAAKYMTQAVTLDPGYAVAWAHLSGSLSTNATFETAEPELARERMRESRLAADKALRLAPGLGPAHAARAYLHFYEFDQRSALAECRRAVQLAPEDGTVLNGCSYTLAGMGKLQEALRLRERLLSIEPLYTVNYFQYAELLMATGRLDEAEKYLRTGEALAGQPQPGRHMMLALLRGDASAARGIAMQASPGDRGRYMALAAQIGPDRAAADTELAKFMKDRNDCTGCTSRDVVTLHALNGDVGPTVEWLERDWAQQRGNALFILSNPFVLRFRDNPRFIAFCKKIGLAPPSESEAMSIDQIQAQASGYPAERG